MNIKRTFSAILSSMCLAVLLLAGSSNADGQGRYANRYSRNDVNNIVKRLEQSSDTFRRNFDRAMDNSNINGTQAEDRFNNTVRDFEASVDQLRRQFDRDDSWWQSRAQVENMVRDAGAEVAEITLHVGYGTFEPVRVAELSRHKVASERYEIADGTAALLNTAKAAGRRFIAIGTTTTRALEHSIAKHGKFAAGSDSADLTITPGFKFRAVDSLLTNFHLPQSSLLVLVAAFAGYEFTMDAYRHAVASRYRFYSYGDCMFIT